jgi:CDP-glycerol glycerophosphotransferase (TagB/SpsB family)
MKLLDENGYKTMFTPHSELLEYCHLFDMPDTVALSTEEPYQELFNKSKILITDYSSVFFDFAYLKKPVIYYREDNEVFHYDEGYFDFESMGFGDLIYDEDELVGKIEGYLADDCRMEDKYINRVDNFFKFTDKNNCKRVYDCLYKIR